VIKLQYVLNEERWHEMFLESEANAELNYFMNTERQKLSLNLIN
jgi:hypothetical protein